MNSGIYVIKNKINNNVYIGSAVKLDVRIKRHFYQLRTQTHHNLYLQRAYNKYGENNFEFHIVEHVDDISKLEEIEQWWIDNCVPEYNISKSSTAPMLGRNHTNEFRSKQSQRMMGNQYSKGKTNGNGNLSWTGKKQSAEHIQKRTEQIIKPVAQIDIITGEIIKVWDSVTSAATSLNLDKSTLVKVCKGKRNHTGGYKWEYKNG